MQVRIANATDLPVIADVHVAAFPGFFLAELGRSFLVAYYRTVLKYGQGVLLVAVHNEKPIGFVAGFIDPDRFYAVMARSKWRFVVPALWGLLCNPRLLRRFFNRSRQVMSTGKQSQERRNEACELSSIGVHPTHAGQGVGRLLVTAFLSASAEKGATTVFLTTDARHNEKVNEFYRNLGFELTRTLEKDGVRSMNEYVFSIHAN